MKKPLVSILLPVHNSQKHLKECIASIRRQSYRNIEIIVIDDRSNDSSYKILRTLKKRNKRARVYRNVKRYGIAVTLNRLVRRAKGQIVGFVSANDILHRERVKRQVLYLLKNPEVVALGTQCVFINKKNIPIGKSGFPEENKAIYSNSPLHGVSMQLETVLINKSNLPKDIIKFEATSLPFIYSDFLIKLLPYGKFENLGGFLHRHRKNPNDYLSDLRRHALSLAKLWIKSVDSYDYQPSFRLLFSNILKSNFGTKLLKF